MATDAEELAKLRAEMAPLREAAQAVVRLQEETVATFRNRGIKFTDIGADPENWQHVAFTVYTNLCEAAALARDAIPSVDSESEEGEA